jgi:hypothetical protein
VWCTAPGDVATDATKCKTNSDYSYPDAVNGYGQDTLGKRKYKLGAPYYYRIAPTEYCTDASLTDCLVSDVPTISAGKSYNVPAPVRFCPNATSASNQCHAKRIPGSREYPRFLGQLTGVPTASAAKGLIIIQNPQADSAQGTITDITVDGVSVLNTKPLTLPAGQSASAWATLVGAAIGGGYGVSVSANVVSIINPTTGPSGNGKPVSVTTSITGTSPASVVLTVANTRRSSSSPSWGTVSQLIIDGLNFVTVPINCDHNNCNSNTQSTRNSKMAELIRNRLTPPPGWTVSGSGAQVIITAPSSTGSEKNGTDVAVTDSNTDLTGTLKLANGVTTGDVNHTTQNFSGGTDGPHECRPVRAHRPQARANL